MQKIQSSRLDSKPTPTFPLNTHTFTWHLWYVTEVTIAWLLLVCNKTLLASMSYQFHQRAFQFIIMVMGKKKQLWYWKKEVFREITVCRRYEREIVRDLLVMCVGENDSFHQI